MGTINVGGKNLQFVGADASNNVIKTSDGKYYQKGANGKYYILKDGESIFNATQQKTKVSQNYNKSCGFVQNKKYYVVGNSSYYTMIDKNYNTIYYRDNQRITKEQFLKGANCVYDTKSKKYIAKNANVNNHKYPEKYRKTVPDSKTGRYYVLLKGDKKLYFEKNGQQISERAFLDAEKACLDKNGHIVKYDWKKKTSNFFEGIGNMFADMVTEAKPVPKRNKDGSIKTKREFSLSRTCTTLVVGAAIVLAAPAITGIVTTLGASAALASSCATFTNCAIAGWFVHNGVKQIYNAEKRNQDVTLSNNERAENWKEKGQGSAQVAMGLTMGGKSIKNAPKTYVKAKSTAKAIETRNNATMTSKGKISIRDKFANRYNGLKETRTSKDIKNNSAKQTAKETVKAPIKVIKNAVTDTYNTLRHPARTFKN